MSSFENALQEITSKKNVDLNLPNFTSTKYNKPYWRIMHFTTYFLFALFFLLAQIEFNKLKAYKEIFFIFGSFCYLLSSIIEWFHFRRGCCGEANLNNPVKANIDKTCSAKMKRSEIGIKYFLNIIITLFLITVGIFKKIQKFQFLHEIIILTAMALLIISQLFKIERALTNTKQYNVKNDLSNSIVEILNFTGAMIFFTCYLLVLLKEYSINDLNIILIVGASFFVLSSFVLYYRYFLSGFDDLNVSNNSFMTIMYE
jgi:hypothetical protein